VIYLCATHICPPPLPACDIIPNVDDLAYGPAPATQLFFHDLRHLTFRYDLQPVHCATVRAFAAQANLLYLHRAIYFLNCAFSTWRLSPCLPYLPAPYTAAISRFTWRIRVYALYLAALRPHTDTPLMCHSYTWTYMTCCFDAGILAGADAVRYLRCSYTRNIYLFTVLPRRTHLYHADCVLSAGTHVCGVS